MRKRRIKDAQSSLNVQLMYGNENWQKKRQNAVLSKYTLKPVPRSVGTPIPCRQE